MTTPQCYLSTRELPGGNLTYLVVGAIVVGASFRGESDVLERSALEADSWPDIARGVQGDLVGAALEHYAAGDLQALDHIAVAQPGGPFMQSAWEAMRTIRAGSVDTYAGLARRAGSPRAHRAAGTACSSNLVAPFVPCHRVVASGGLGGYGYGLEVKRALLAHEGVLID